MKCRNSIGPAIVEPVDDLHSAIFPRFGVVGEHLDRHLLVDDFPDSLPRAIGQSDLGGVPGSAAEHHADLFPELVDEDRGGLGLAQRAGDLAQGWDMSRAWSPT